MASENANNIIKTMLVTLPKGYIPTVGEIKELADRFRNVFPVSDEDFEYVIRKIHARQPLTMDLGAAVVAEDHQSWLLGRKPSITPYYWERYEQFLIKEEDWSPGVAETLGEVAEEILDLMGNPVKPGSWISRGLVMGDVQSGKTSTYTALCCKAADAGYKLIILLTGTLENLRRQTQERLDAGFVGLDSSGILATQQRQTKLIGTGLIDSNRTPGIFTSNKTDFKSDLINQLGFRLESFAEPILVVVKKHGKILENLESWLRLYNANANGKIDTPVLLIDDEADNASVNTNPKGKNPTAINSRINSLLELFTRSSYVGFTATPFANIFIDPDTDTEMYNDYLFPRDFIYSLEAPTNYIGADAIFYEGGKASFCKKDIEDAEDFFPTPHAVDHHVEGLPESLEEALYSFLLVNAIRDLRSEGPTHRSMLVNVSRFTNVQDQVANLLDSKLKKLQQDIRNYSQLPAEDAMANSNISKLHKVWVNEYSDTEFSWEKVLPALHNAALPITVRSVNKNSTRRSGTAGLDYKVHKDDGLRVIAVGGNSLSRGITLEGLCISYFYRNSQMYDTLMQMGRWFGYREDYEDLCRVWMSQEASQWYGHIALATRELREEIKKMRRDGLTPRDFGLKVRAHPDSLIVTARNKMRLAKTIERLVSVSQQGPETPRLHTDETRIAANAKAVESFIRTLAEKGFTYDILDSSTLWSAVPKKNIVSLLRDFSIHPLNLHFQGDNIATFLEQTNIEKLEKWDVAIPNGGNEETKFADILYRPQRRKVELRGRGKYVLVSGSKARVGSRGVEKEGVPQQVVKSITEYYERLGKSVSDKAYREVRERPLLLIHIIDAMLNKQPYKSDYPLIALGLSFPKFDDSGEGKKVVYKVNLIEWRNIFEQESDDDEEPDEE